MRGSSPTAGPFRLRWPKVAVASAATLVLVAAPLGASADPLSDQRTRIRGAEARIAGLESRLSALFAEMAALDTEMTVTYTRLGYSYLRVNELETRLASAQVRFNERVRAAYKRGGLVQAAMLLRVHTLVEFFTSSRILGETIRADGAAWRELEAARQAMIAERIEIDEEKGTLLDTSGRLAAIKAEIRSALASEAAILADAKSELARLESQRRAVRTVSPAVEARRAARQVELDRKLAALLDWYAPGAGPEPFMPPKLRGTGISTTGLSSWYGPGFDGRRASSGATYRQTQLTAASLVLPFGTLLKVSYGNKAVVVVITDRGPYVPGRVLDLSAAAAQAVGLTGVKSVRMEVVVPSEPAPQFP